MMQRNSADKATPLLLRWSHISLLITALALSGCGSSGGETASLITVSTTTTTITPTTVSTTTTTAPPTTIPPATVLGAGQNHTVIITSDMALAVVGSNSSGQLGIEALTDSSLPAQVSGVGDVAAIAAGSFHTVALRRDGTVWQWGGWLWGAPAKVAGLDGVTVIAAGAEFTVALRRDGTVWTWGRNAHGQLGDGTLTERSTPMPVTGLSGVVSIAAYGEHAVALRQDGTVWEWGAYGVEGDIQAERLHPVAVSGLAGATEIATGAYHTVALREDGTVWAWGSNFSGQLGDGTTVAHNVPAQVAGLIGVAAIAAGEMHTVALKRDGTVWAWGRNSSGALGDGTTTFRSIPVQVLGLNGVMTISAGGYFSVALREDRTVWAWGDNVSGQLGDRISYSTTAVQVRGQTGAVAIAAGRGHVVALMPDGTVWAWGGNESAQLGEETTTGRVTAEQIPGLSGIAAVAAVGYRTAALRNNGTVWEWGWGHALSQMTDGRRVVKSIPEQIMGFSGVVRIAMGGDIPFSPTASGGHTVALRYDGTVWGWGRNSYGQLGDGTQVDKLAPVQAGGIAGVAAIAAGTNHTVALKQDGTVWVWGYLGPSCSGRGCFTTVSVVPIEVPGLNGVVAIGATGNDSFALKRDGTVWVYGRPYTVSHGGYYPTLSQVPGLTGAVKIAPGGEVVVLKQDGTVWSVKPDSTATIDDNVWARAEVLPVSGLSGVVEIAAGTGHALALKQDGTVWAWGKNYYGQLGDGTRTDRVTPVQVVGVRGMAASFLDGFNR